MPCCTSCNLGRRISLSSQSMSHLDSSENLPHWLTAMSKPVDSKLVEVLIPDFNVLAAYVPCASKKAILSTLEVRNLTGLYTPGKLFFHRYVKIYFLKDIFYNVSSKNTREFIFFKLLLTLGHFKNILDLELNSCKHFRHWLFTSKSLKNVH